MPTRLQEHYPHRATHWQLRTQAIEFASSDVARPRIMGIINVTPDSFSDGGAFVDPPTAIEHGQRLVEAGADILDVGGESTRPYSAPVSVEEELDRTVEVIDRLCDLTDVPISIDTSKSQVAEAAVAVGAEIINDVTALTADPEMVSVALKTGAGICAMHMQGTPQTMQEDPQYEEVVSDVKAYLQARFDTLRRAGIATDRICVDPGIGFGKSTEHNLELLRRVGEFHAIGAPLLVGHSRKGFLAKLIGDQEADRCHATVGVALALARHGVQIIRVHDVGAVHQALAAFVAVGGLAP